MPPLPSPPPLLANFPLVLDLFVQDILCVPSVAGVCPPNEYETFESQQVASDCLWSDPARDNQVLACLLACVNIVGSSRCGVALGRVRCYDRWQASLVSLDSRIDWDV